MEHGPWAEALLGWKESSERLIWSDLWSSASPLLPLTSALLLNRTVHRETPHPPNMQLTPLLSCKLQQEGPEVRPFHVEWNPLSLTRCVQLEVRRQSQGPCGYQRLWRTHSKLPLPSLSFPGQEPQPGLPFSPRSVFLKGLHLSHFVVVFNGARSISSASLLCLWRNRGAHRQGPFWVITWVHEAFCLGVADSRCWMWLKETTRASSDV